MTHTSKEPRIIIKCLDTFDYIIVGAGAAGAIVASRLSEANFKVLLLERGNCFSWFNKRISDPTQWALVPQDKAIDWNYKSVEQTHLNKRVIEIPRAKALGGCQVW